MNSELDDKNSRPVVLDCCFMLEQIPKLSIKPDFLIYVKCLETNFGEWREGEELYSGDKEPTPFRQQMKDYHKKFKPATKADFTYNVRMIVLRPD